VKPLRILLAAVAAFAFVTMMSCDETTTGGDWSVFDVQTVTGSLDALDAADSIYIASMASQGAGAAAEAAVAYLEAHASVEAVRATRDSSVTVFFKNGLLGTVYQPDLGNRDSLGLAFLTPEQVRTAAGGEAIPSAVVLTPFARTWGKVAEDWVAGMLDTCFGGDTAATERFTNEQVTVDKVKEVLTAGPGVLLWSSHGALIFKDYVNWGDWVVLLTGEGYGSAAMAQRIINYYSDGARASGGDRELVVATVDRVHYLAVTPKFVRNYGNFDYMEGMGHNATKSLVYACCCYSGMQSGEMPEAFWSVGVDVYMGWSESVKALFAAQRQVLFFRNATDTCTINQSYYGIGDVTDPWKGAQLLCYQGDSMMIRSQMRFSKDGTALHGYSVGVAMASGVTTVNCFASQPMQLPEYGITVHFPGASTGSFNCVAQDDAEIVVVSFSSGRAWHVRKDYKGVTGSIEVQRYDDYVVSGTFSGTLGYWSSHNPTEYPPDETIEIQNGIFKHLGLRQ
jgi:hypothetical protein